MLRLFALFMLTQLVSAISSAGFDRGNGGTGVACPDQNFQVLDLYELEHRFEIKPQFPQGQDEFQIAVKILGRLQSLDPYLSSKLIQSIEEMKSSTYFLTNLKLIDFPDVGLSMIPEFCELKQIAVQQTAIDGEWRVNIVKNLWDELSIEGRATLVIHEILVKHARDIQGNLSSTEGVRYFNGLLIASAFEKMTLREYSKILMKVGLGQLNYRGWMLFLERQTLKFSPTSESIILEASLAPPFLLPPGSLNNLPVTCHNLGRKPRVQFYESAKVRFLDFSEADCEPLSIHHKNANEEFRFVGRKFLFYPSGKIKMIEGFYRQRDYPYEIFYRSNGVEIRGELNSKFDQILVGFSAEGHVLHASLGRAISCEEDLVLYVGGRRAGMLNQINVLFRKGTLASPFQYCPF